jgi:hypothetical protein
MTPSNSHSRDWEGIYARRIRPDLLGGIEPSKVPTAVIVRGQPGSGAPYALERVRMNLRAAAGAAAVISSRAISAYETKDSFVIKSTTPGTEAASSDVDRWVTRLLSDAASHRIDVVLESGLSTGGEERFTTLAATFKEAGYQVATVNLATDRDQSRQSMLASRDMANQMGIPTAELSFATHDAAYEQVRKTLAELESDCSVDRIQLVTTDGRQLYANQLHSGTWVREPRAVHVLDDFRERQLTARELADSALRWDILVRRISSDASAPAELVSQASQWRAEMLSRVQADPDAIRLLTWGREAQQFLTMNRYEFKRQFPQYAASVQRLEEAVMFAEGNFADASDRHRFIEQTRRRLAERIAEGRADGAKRSKAKEGPPHPKSR